MSKSQNIRAHLSEQASKLRELMINYEEFLPLLEVIMRDNDPSVIQALLSIVDFPRLPHQMFAIIHAVESFPQDVYIPEFIASIEAMSRNSKEFLDLMVVRILNSSDDCLAFAAELNRCTNESTRTEAVQSLKRIASEDSEFHERCENIVRQLEEHRA